MSADISVPETISELAELVRSGNIRAARKLGRKLLKVAPTRTLWVIARIANELDERPHTALAFINHLLETAPSEEDRAIVAACLPEPGETRRTVERSSQRAPHWNSTNKHEAPRDLKTEQRNELRRKARSRQEQADAAGFARYRVDSAGVADGDQVPDRHDRAAAEQVYASGFDYDRAALYATEVPFACLACGICRGRYDLNGARVQAGHGDDMLCGECRAAGCAGLPELVVGHSLADLVTARCSFVWAKHGDVVARALLRSDWRHAPTDAVREIITDYARAYLSAEPPTEARQDVAELSDCVTCGVQREPNDTNAPAADDGQCAACRELAAELDELAAA
ncbi:hypothetical protein [Lentzea kentuckyensis]|uniref:hypothetical protein n=1 Tax=Lentzea kentuckyensis TaxID=360086 RepID=UPI00117B6656|nr:hypothetical protein [Lentzea kentuckyensis]